MASALAQQVHEMTFVLQELVTTQVGDLSASVYPKINSSMPIFERAHTFQVVKNTLEPLPIATQIILDMIGMQLNCSAIVDGLIYNWRITFDEARFDFRNLAIILFHDSAGAQINNTTIASNPAVLLPAQDGAVALCCKQDVRFIRVMCTINFQALITIPNPGPTTLCIEFYIELPQTTVMMVNSNKVAYNLTAWHGAANLAQLVHDQVCATILKPSLQDGPILLSPANFNLGDANVNAITIHETIHMKILHLGFRQITASIFVQLCHGYSNQPHAVLEHIRQTLTGVDGQPVTASVIEYYQKMTNAACPFATQWQYALTVCDCFIHGLDCTLMPQFRKNYPQHSSIYDLSGANQHRMLQIILAAAQAAKDKCQQIQDIACKIVTSQGFFMQGMPSAKAYPSQAETTIAKYKEGTQFKERVKLHCWGCGGDHSWMCHDIITCLCGTEPQVLPKAKDNSEQWMVEVKKGGIRPKTKEKKRGAKIAKFNDLDKLTQKKYCKSVLASLVARASTNSSTTLSITSATSTPALSVPGPSIFMLYAPVLSTAPPAHHILPVPIQAAIPHITLQRGFALGDENCPMICCVVDTATALTTSNLHFFANLAKAYPHTVASIHSPSDYSPITLSGIVQHDGNFVTTILCVTFRFHLSYLMREGNPTSFLIATRCDITVNAILDLPFIQQTKMVIDAADQVVKLCAFDAHPFPIDFCHAMCAVPPVDKARAATNAAMHAEIVPKVESIEAFFTKKLPAIMSTSILLPAKQARCLEFHNISSSNSNASAGSRASIGSAIEPSLHDADNAFSLCDVSLSV
jgi:hypothetical protein